MGATSPRSPSRGASPAASRWSSRHWLGAGGGSDYRSTLHWWTTLGPDPAGGFRISGIVLSVSGSAQGVSPEDFAKIAADAKAGCPVSKALTGTTITLDVKFAG